MQRDGGGLDGSDAIDNPERTVSLDEARDEIDTLASAYDAAPGDAEGRDIGGVDGDAGEGD